MAVHALLRLGEAIRSCPPQLGPEAIALLSARLADVRADDLDVAGRFARLDRGQDWRGDDLYDDGEVHLSLFLVPKGRRMPLHDHPGMTVLLKVLWGRARLRAFEWAREYPFSGLAQAAFDGEVHGASPVQVVQPLARNLHAIEALDDCAFLDLFAPYYDDAAGRVCRYYREVERVTRQGQELARLALID